MGWLAAKLVPHGVDFSFCVYVAILFTGLARLALLAQVNTHTILTCDWLPDTILTGYQTQYLLVIGYQTQYLLVIGYQTQ